jgi:hypothetical protein
VAANTLALWRLQGLTRLTGSVFWEEKSLRPEWPTVLRARALGLSKLRRRHAALVRRPPGTLVLPSPGGASTAPRTPAWPRKPSNARTQHRQRARHHGPTSWRKPPTRSDKPPKRRRGTARAAALASRSRGHFNELLDIKTYNAKGRFIRHRLDQRPGATNPGYDASRFIRGKFAGGVQQKSSTASVEKAISQIEKHKPGTASRGTLRVPRDHLDEAKRRAVRRIRVEGMDFTSGQAGAKLDQGLSDLAKGGARATSTVRAAAKGATFGAAVNVALGSLTDAGSLKRGEMGRRDFAEHRALDGTESASMTLAGVAASGAGTAVGTAALTAALGTATGTAAAASIGGACTAVVGAISGMGAAGAAAGTALGAVTVATAAPAVLGVAAVLGAGLVIGKGYRQARKALTARQIERRELEVAPEALALTVGDREANGILVTDADVIQVAVITPSKPASHTTVMASSSGAVRLHEMLGEVKLLARE